MADEKQKDLSLLNKYQALLIENDRLKSENKRLKEQLNNSNLPIISNIKENLTTGQIPQKKSVPADNLIDTPAHLTTHSHLMIRFVKIFKILTYIYILSYVTVLP